MRGLPFLLFFTIKPFYLQKEYDNHEPKAATKKEMETKSSSALTESELRTTYRLKALLPVEMIPSEDIDKPVFPSSAMGKGVGIEPTDGVVTALFDG